MMPAAGHRSGLLMGAAGFTFVWAGLCLLLPLTTDNWRVLLVIGPLVGLSVLGLRLAAADLRELARAHPASDPPPEPVETGAPDQAPGLPVQNLARDQAPLPADFAALRPPVPSSTVAHELNSKNSAAQSLSSTLPPPIDEIRGLPVELGPEVSFAFAKWTLHYRVAGLTGTVDVPVQKPEILIGRAPDNHIVIHHSEVSSSHLRLYVHRDRIQVVDLESRNGSSLSLGGVQSEMIARHLYDWPVGAEVAIPRQSPAVVALVLAPKERK